MDLDNTSKYLCVTFLPWGLYRYNILLIGIIVSSDVLQSAISGLFIDIEGAFFYIDEILVIGASTFEEHMATVDEAQIT